MRGRSSTNSYLPDNDDAGYNALFRYISWKEVFRQLHNNPFVEIMASEGKEFVKVSGKADFDVDVETQKWIYDNNPVLPRLYTSFYKMAYFKVEIEEMDHYDLKPTPPMFKHYNLNDNTVNDGYVGERYSKK